MWVKLKFKIFKPIFIFIFKFKNVHLSYSSIFDDNSYFEGANSVLFRSNVKDSHFGYGSYVGEDCLLISTKIGRFCSIGTNVKVIMNNHPTTKYVSTHPAFYRSSHALMAKLRFKFNQEHQYIDKVKIDNKYDVVIGSDVWIGTDVKIMSGVKISDGAVVGAGSIVTKDIEPYSINVGVPTRCVSYRFSTDKIEKLLSISWWESNISDIKKHQKCFLDIDIFLNEYK